jgi:hypothetical protein
MGIWQDFLPFSVDFGVFKYDFNGYFRIFLTFYPFYCHMGRLIPCRFKINRHRSIL